MFKNLDISQKSVDIFLPPLKNWSSEIWIGHTLWSPLTSLFLSESECSRNTVLSCDDIGVPELFCLAGFSPAFPVFPLQFGVGISVYNLSLEERSPSALYSRLCAATDPWNFVVENEEKRS